MTDGLPFDFGRDTQEVLLDIVVEILLDILGALVLLIPWQQPDLDPVAIHLVILWFLHQADPWDAFISVISDPWTVASDHVEHKGLPN